MAGIKSGYCLLYGAVVPLPTQVPISLKMAGSLAWIALWYISSMFVVSTAAVAVDKDAMAPIVDLGYAQYQGYFDAPMNITNFLGIRYAAPPVGQCSTRLRLIVAMTDSRVGNLRFRAPQMPDVESGVQPEESHQVLSNRTRSQHESASDTLRTWQTTKEEVCCLRGLPVSQVSAIVQPALEKVLLGIIVYSCLGRCLRNQSPKVGFLYWCGSTVEGAFDSSISMHVSHLGVQVSIWECGRVQRGRPRCGFYEQCNRRRDSIPPRCIRYAF